MQSGTPSRTALTAAAYRAEHQVLDGGRIFRDPLALRILGLDAAAVARNADPRPAKRLMRWFVALRTRFAEDALRDAITDRVRQGVVLGAGLDTYGYRAELPDGFHLFEVDHPDTQAWKQDRLREAAIPVPPWLTFASIDFERETLAEALTSAGFDSGRPAFFTWLGVVPYLTESAFWATVEFIAEIAGAHVVFDYSEPPESLDPWTRAVHERRAARLTALGEALVTFFEPAALHSRLRALGYSCIEDFSAGEIASRYLPNRVSTPARRGGRVLHAAT